MKLTFFQMFAASPLRLIVVLVLVAGILTIAAGELLAAAGHGDCEDHCEESCQTCGDCIHCLPTFHMLAGQAYRHDHRALHADGVLPAYALCRDGIFAAAIDHPPQNLL